MISKGVYLKCDPYSGWCVVSVDEWDNEQKLAGDFPSMEEAARAAVTQTYEPLYVPFDHK